MLSVKISLGSLQWTITASATIGLFAVLSACGCLGQIYLLCDWAPHHYRLTEMLDDICLLL